MVLLDEDELRQVDEADEMLEVSNSDEVMVAVHIDGEVEVDGDDEMEVYETEAETMIKEQDEEVDMWYQQPLILYLLNDDELQVEITEALQ